MGNINIELPDELHRKLKILAINTGGTLKDTVTSALEQGVRRKVRK